MAALPLAVDPTSQGRELTPTRFPTVLKGIRLRGVQAGVHPFVVRPVPASATVSIDGPAGNRAKLR